MGILVAQDPQMMWMNANQEGARGKEHTHADGFVDGIGNDFHDLRFSRVDICEIPQSALNW